MVDVCDGFVEFFNGFDFQYCKHCGCVLPLLSNYDAHYGLGSMYRTVNFFRLHYGGVVCEDCYNDNYFTCSDCADVFSLNREHYIDNLERSVCHHCIDNYFECNNCGGMCYVEDGVTLNNDTFLCSDCADARRSSVVDLCRDNVKNVLDVRCLSRKDSFNVFGVEVEAIVDNDIDTSSCFDGGLDYFSVVEDGSLSCNGLEFVSVPLGCDMKGYDVLRKFCDGFGSDYLSVDKSCGFHIHLYMDKDLVTINNLKKIIIAYKRLEELFFGMNPPSRSGNDYCRSLSDDFFGRLLYDTCDLNSFLSLFYDKSINNIKEVPKDKYNANRYFYVNLNSIFYRNTIEIRVHSGTVNFKKMFYWVEINRRLLNYLVHTRVDVVFKHFNRDVFLYEVLDSKLRKYVFMRTEQFKRVSCEDDREIMHSSGMGVNVDLSWMDLVEDEVMYNV